MSRRCGLAHFHQCGHHCSSLDHCLSCHCKRGKSAPLSPRCNPACSHTHMPAWCASQAFAGVCAYVLLRELRRMASRNRIIRACCRCCFRPKPNLQSSQGKAPSGARPPSTSTGSNVAQDSMHDMRRPSLATSQAAASAPIQGLAALPPLEPVSAFGSTRNALDEGGAKDSVGEAGGDSTLSHRTLYKTRSPSDGEPDDLAPMQMSGAYNSSQAASSVPRMAYGAGGARRRAMEPIPCVKPADVDSLRIPHSHTLCCATLPAGL